MKVGTKSLLFGCHQFFLHPLIVGYCYLKLYGWTWNPLIWISIIIHDWGYWGRDNMDGDEPETGGRWHPYWAFYTLFNWACYEAAYFCLYHSRYMVENSNVFRLKNYKIIISRLGVADKLAIVYTPLWLYNADELQEYTIEEMKQSKTKEENFAWRVLSLRTGKEIAKAWKQIVDEKCLEFVEEWKDKAYDIQQYKA